MHNENFIRPLRKLTKRKEILFDLLPKLKAVVNTKSGRIFFFFGENLNHKQALNSLSSPDNTFNDQNYIIFNFPWSNDDANIICSVSQIEGSHERL